MEFGTNRLLKQGAIAITDARDMIESFKELEYDENACSKRAIPFISIPEKYQEIYKLLEKKCMDINEISRTLKKPVNEISGLLFMMEIDEYIDRKADGEYFLREE